ncbi:MAG: hypothetical protein KF718_12775 [Polyangiaceae bacterium]|nr:hypothetical protein [Polyangiaceae bacterium]
MIGLLCSTAAGCLASTGPSVVARGNVQYVTGDPQFDEFFAALHALQVELGSAPSTERDARRGLAARLGVPPGAPADDMIEAARQAATRLALGGTRLRVDLGTDTVAITPIGAPLDEEGQALVDDIGRTVRAHLEIAARATRARPEADRLAAIEPVLRAQVDSAFRKSLRQRSDVRKNLADAALLFALIRVRANEVRGRASATAERLADAVRTDDGRAEAPPVALPLPPADPEGAPTTTPAPDAPVDPDTGAPEPASDAPVPVAVGPEDDPPLDPAPPPQPAKPHPKLEAPPQADSTSVDSRSASTHWQRDCAADPTQEICRERGSASIGPSGAFASFSRETVTRVKEPPSGSVNFAIDGSVVFGRTSYEMPVLFQGQTPATIESTFTGGGVSLGVKILTGGKFPGQEGGSWVGAFIDPAVAVSGAGGQLTIPAMNVGSVHIPEYQQGYGMLLIDGGVSAGVQWLVFGSMDPTTLRQGGFGLQGGYRIGAQGSQMYFKGGSGDFTVGFAHGPVFGVTLPTYNAGTAHLTRVYVQGMVLPFGDIFLVTVAAGAAF